MVILFSAPPIQLFVQSIVVSTFWFELLYQSCKMALEQYFAKFRKNIIGDQHHIKTPYHESIPLEWSMPNIDNCFEDSLA